MYPRLKTRQPILPQSKHDAGFCIEIKSEKSRQIAARRSYSMTSTTKSIVFTNKNQIESDHVKIEALSEIGYEKAGVTSTT